MKLKRWMRHGLAMTSTLLVALASCGHPDTRVAFDAKINSKGLNANSRDINPAQKKVLLLSATSDRKSDLAIDLAVKSMEANQVAFEHVAVTKEGSVQENLELNLVTQDGMPRFSAVVLTSDKLLFKNTEGKWVSGLGSNQWKQLSDYESSQKIRRVSLYAYPAADAGMAPAGEPSGNPVKLATVQGAEEQLADIGAVDQIALENSWRYPSKVINAELARPVLMFKGSSEEGVAAAVIRMRDGREQLQFYFSQAPTIKASQLLAPLWLKWVLPAVQNEDAQPDLIEGVWKSAFEGFEKFQGDFTFTRNGNNYIMDGNLGALAVSGPAIIIGNEIAGAWTANGNDALIASIQQDTAESAQNASGRFVAGPNGGIQGQFTIEGIDLDGPQGKWNVTGKIDQESEFAGKIEFYPSGDDQDRFHVALEIEGQLINGMALRTKSGMALVVAQKANAGLYVHSLPVNGKTEGRWVRIGQDATFRQQLNR
jgi:hypothetical protein